MQFKLSTDYAVRIIMYLYTHEKVSSLELSEQLGISRNYIKKLLTKTRLQEFVSSSSGYNGGFILKKDVKELTMYDVVSVMEPSMFVNSCLDNPHKCQNCLAFVGECPVKQCYQNIQDKIEQRLKEVTIYELCLEHTYSQNG